MKKFKKIYRIITVIIVLILGIGISVWNAEGHPEYVAAFKSDKLSEGNYYEFKTYADIYAKTQDRDAINNKKIEITREISETSTLITVNEARGGIRATYPSEIKSSSNEGEFIVNISYKNGEYEEYSNIRNILFYIFNILFIALIFGAIFFIILYFPIIFIVSIINWIIVKIKKRKNIEN